MRRLNRAWVEAGRPAPQDERGWQQVADLYGCADNDLLRIRTQIASDPPREPFPADQIEALEARLAALRAP